MFTLGILFRTLVHKAVTSLQAQIRWILSGTPLQNTVNDSKDIHINMDIDTQTDLNRLRV